MSNRSISMYEYRQVISHMRLGESDRAIARSGLVSRTKAKEIRAIAMSQQWLEPTIELPSDKDLSKHFESQMACKPNESLVLPYYEEVEQWVQQSIQATTIQQALMRKYGFSGSYSSVQRLVKKIKSKRINATTVLNFLPGESAQVDFGSGPKVKDTVNGELVKTWVFVMVLSWSRHQYAELVTNQRAFNRLGAFLFFVFTAFYLFGMVVVSVLKTRFVAMITYDRRTIGAKQPRGKPRGI